ncbi:MFS domain-containing protein [Caerostris extrusa]|uniref:MFS domain-containing protein n=1 Tax=Caerostris extrusa TaxID=172846 RepID=A0AAV4TB61_CAEEX|nr:MFS domain-containing protein [Caerostris extrusa]
MSFVAHGLRFFAYSFLGNPWWSLAVEFLQGPSFGSFYAALTSYAKLVAPKGAEATVQGISLAALEGLVNMLILIVNLTGVGSLIGGYWVHNYGGRSAFFYTGVVSIVFGMFSCVISGLTVCKVINNSFQKYSFHRFLLRQLAMFNELTGVVEPDEDQKEVLTFKKLLPIKAHYLLIFGGSSAVYPYISIYAKQLGITADVIGYITAGLWCSTVISRPILGGLADHFQKFKLVLVCMLMISVSTNLGLSFIPQPPQDTTSNSTTNTSVICYQNNSYQMQYDTDACSSRCAEKCIFSCSLCEKYDAECIDLNSSYFIQSGYLEDFSICAENRIAKCVKDAINIESDSTTGNSTDDDTSVIQNAPLQVGLFTTFAIFFFICQTTVESITDAACGNTLGEEMELYGRQRMFGTIGWGIFSLVAGSLNHVFSKSSNTINYSPGFYMSVIFYSLDIIVILNLQLKFARISRRNIFKDVGWLLLKPKIFLFILQVTSIGLIRGVFNTYLLWYLESLGANPLLLGSVTSVQSFLGEVPFLFFSGWIIKKMGHLNVFTMSFAAHGLSFYAAVTSYVKLVAPIGAEATVQGISLAALEGLGTGIGSLVGGYWVHNYGGRTAFFNAGILSMVFGMFSCIISGLTSCKLIK